MTTPSPTRDSLDKAIDEFKNIARKNMDSKRLQLLERWFINWSFYVKRERGFKPHENIKYNAGDVVTVCFGYTVGSEQGGNRPSVVVEDNDHSDKTIMVVPLSSLVAGDSVHIKNVYLGELTEYNKATRNPEGTESIALTNQMRAVSKQRIVRPVNQDHTVFTLDQDKLQLIYDKISNLYTVAKVVTREISEVAGAKGNEK